MPGAMSGGEPVPEDGSLPGSALESFGTRPFGIYVHVPFCTTRCGYCDFNTYTASELGTPGDNGVSPTSYSELVIAELTFARKVLANARAASIGCVFQGAQPPGPPGHSSVTRPEGPGGLHVRATREARFARRGGVSTVFFGGGTPTLLPPAAFGAILRTIDAEFGLLPNAEVTAEANPESVTDASLAQLRAQGVSRMSFGMQSAVPGVLQVLDRVHQPGRPMQCVEWARAAGFEHVSLDLIYGTPGETDVDWRRSLEAAINAGPDHISAYALTVEDGTRLAARVRRGELAAPDDDVLAGRYVIADDLLTAAGYGWYEISNWAKTPSARCAHNMLYWTGGDWWGIGPGAHSHVGSTRWWNVRHPAAYAARISAAVSPGQAREVLTEAEIQLERVMLLTRLSDGCPLDVLDETGYAAVSAITADGLATVRAGCLVLTRRGRLLADTVVRALTA